MENNEYNSLKEKNILAQGTTLGIEDAIGNLFPERELYSV